MKLLFHDQSFDKAMLQQTIDATNTNSKLIEIYISSDGGLVSILEAMLYIINSKPNRFKIIGYDELCSCAFEFYIRAKCNKELIKNTIGMYHQSTTKISINDNLKPAYYDGEAYLKRKKKYFVPNSNDIMTKCEFTPKEIKKIKKGKDVYFQYDRFKELENYYIKNTIL